MHTTETDGRASLEEMAEAARALGYEYIAITDHSKSLAMANGLDERRAVAFARRVREINASGALGIRVFSGIECDILKDGALDLANDALAELDFVIGSVHSHMNHGAGGDDGPPAARARMPARACSGPPHRAAAARPRAAIAFDFERVAAEAVRRGVLARNQCQPGAAGPERRISSGRPMRAGRVS